MKKTDLSHELQDFLSRCPKAGNGVNRWIFLAALKLHRANVPESEMPALISAATKNCGRVVAAQEIERAVVNSGSALRNGSHAERRTPKWPTPNPEQIEAVIANGVGIDGLREMSPVKWSDGRPHTEEIVDALFPGNPFLCVGRSSSVFNTMDRQKWRGRLADCQLIVPSPMTKIFGTTKEGRKSKHSLDNTGLRRFLVVEFDKGTFDEHAAILVHLAQFGPLVMTVYSGSKSLHGWFYVQGQPEAKIEKFFRYAVSLGADPQLWVRCQFVRLPDGRRRDIGKPSNGKRQAVMYFNPSLIKTSND